LVPKIKKRETLLGCHLESFHSFLQISAGEAVMVLLGGEEAPLVLFVQALQTSYLKRKNTTV